MNDSLINALLSMCHQVFKGSLNRVYYARLNMFPLLTLSHLTTRLSDLSSLFGISVVTIELMNKRKRLGYRQNLSERFLITLQRKEFILRDEWRTHSLEHL